MGKGVNLTVISGHLTTFVEHLNEFKQNRDGEAFKAGIGAIHKALEGHDAHHVIHFFHKAAEHIQSAIEFVGDGIEDIADGIEGLKEMLAHVITTAAGVHQAIADINPDAAAEMKDTMDAIHKIHKTVNKVDEIVDQVQEVVDVVIGDDVVEEGGAAEDQDPPKLVIDALPEINEGGDELLSPKVAEEELKELPGTDAASDVADDGDEVEDLKTAVDEKPAVEEKDADLGDDFVGEGADMPTPEAPVVPAVDLGGDFTGLEGSIVVPAADPETLAVSTVGEDVDLSASVVSI